MKRVMSIARRQSDQHPWRYGKSAVIRL